MKRGPKAAAHWSLSGGSRAEQSERGLAPGGDDTVAGKRLPFARLVSPSNTVGSRYQPAGPVREANQRKG